MSPVRLSPVCVVLLLATACGSSATGYTSAPVSAATTAAPVVTGQRINDGGTLDATNLTTVKMQTKNFLFSPSAIHGRPGQKLTLVITNASPTPHNFTLKAQQVNTDLATGATQTVHITLPASGVLVFTCEYHAHSGMAGTVGS